jgi:transposase
MLPLFPRPRFYLYRQPTDMRKSFDGLCGVVTNELGGDPLSGDVYVFINRRRDRMKLLLWERSGFWLFYKRLEKGTFQRLPNPNQQASLELSAEELMMLLEGIDLTSIKRRPRYQQYKFLKH